jgi:hypothetical protein
MKNAIAELIEAYDDFFNDFYSLLRDLEYIIINKFRWIYYENKKIGKRCRYTSFYNANDLLYVYFNLTEDVPYIQISLFHISDADDENDDEVGLDYLEEHWKGVDPSFYLQNRNYEVNVSKNGFKIIINEREKYIFSPEIDIMSITSSEVIDEDIRRMIEVLISGSYEDYKPIYLSYVEYEENNEV